MVLGDQQRTRILGGPEIQDIAVWHVIHAADFFLKTAQYTKLDLLLALIPEAHQRFIEPGNFRSHVAHHVQCGVKLHLQASEHAQAEDDVQVRPAFLYRVLAQLGEHLHHKPFWRTGSGLRYFMGRHGGAFLSV